MWSSGMFPLRYYLHFSGRKKTRSKSENRLKNTNSGDKNIQLTHFYKLDVSYATQHAFWKVPFEFWKLYLGNSEKGVGPSTKLKS